MKKLFVVLLAGGFIAAAGYVLGTEAGRRQRDLLIAKIRRSNGDGPAEGVAIDLAESTSAVTEATQPLRAGSPN